MSAEYIAPDTILVHGTYVPVTRAIAHPPGRHPDSPIRNEHPAVELVTVAGSRWMGVGRAWIGSDLQLHAIPLPGNSALSAWIPVDEHPHAVREEN